MEMVGEAIHVEEVLEVHLEQLSWFRLGCWGLTVVVEVLEEEVLVQMELSFGFA